IDEGRRGPERAYAIDPAPDPARAAALAENLMQAGVEVAWVQGPVRSAAARPVWVDLPPKAAPRAAGRRDTGSGSKSGAKPEAASAAGGRPARVGMPREPEATFAPHEFAGGALVVDLAQPAGRLARTLIERDAPVDSGFARAQLDKYARNL